MAQPANKTEISSVKEDAENTTPQIRLAQEITEDPIPKEKPEDRVEELKEDAAQNATEELLKIEKNEGNETVTIIPDLSTNPPKTKVENQTLTETDEKNENLTKIEQQNPKKVREVNEQEDPSPFAENSNFLETNTDVDVYFQTTEINGKNIGRENEKYIDPSEATQFSNSSKVSDHFYFSMVNFVIVLWLILHMYPKIKRFFNWVQKKVIKSGKLTPRMKKQKN